MFKKKEEEKLLFFRWDGVNRRGIKVEGVTRAASASALKQDLRKKNINPLSVKKKRPSHAQLKRIDSTDIALFSRQLAQMLSSGISVVQAMQIIANGLTKIRMQDMVLNIKNSIETGQSIAGALGNHPKYFDNLYISLIDAGEKSGTLETLLDKIATYKEKTESMKKKIKKAMMYPMAVLVVAFLVAAVMLIYVIPEFADMFKGFGADLPTFTKLVIELSDWFVAWWWAVIIGIGFAISSFKMALQRSPQFRDRVEILALRAPVFGNIISNAAVARFSRTLATMFAAGVPLVDALKSVANATGNALYRDSILRMRDDVMAGISLENAMSYTGVFPIVVNQMISIGEEAGSLDAMLSRVADIYEEEVDNAVDGLSSLMEPVILVVLGGMIGSLVSAMYLPVFNMGKVV